jgi:hypothetical protein
MGSPTVIRSIVVVPGGAHVTHVSDRGAVPVPLRTARRFDELAAALGRRVGVPASVSDAADPPLQEGTVVVCRPDVLHRLAEAVGGTLPWVIAVDLDRTAILERPEALGLAGAVGVADYFDWLNSAPRPAAIFGRKEIASAIGATVDTRPLQSTPRYTRMTRDGGDLPALLGDYLLAYAAADIPAQHT